MGARSSKAKATAVYAKTQIHQEVNDMVYRATPLSIGYRVGYDEMFVQIRKNTSIPTNKFEATATTAYDNQEAMYCYFYQGERKRASANQLLGTLVVEGIPPAPRGVAKITISLDVDVEGNLNVSAHEKSTGKKLASKSIPGVGVKGKFVSTEEEVEKMARQGEKHKSEDEEHLEKMKIMKEMEEHAIAIRKNAAAGGYSRKAWLAFKKVAEKMLDEFNEKAKEFGSEGAAVLSTT